MGQRRPLFGLFSVFSNKHHNNFYNISIWKNVMSIQNMVPGFKPMTCGIWASSHNHKTSGQSYTALNDRNLRH